ncbi:hypothetical protein ACFLY6_00150 [Candidatus Dependentiae bacterium]
MLRLRDYRNRAEMATIFHKAVELKSDDRANGNLEIMPFYRQTYHRDKLGKGIGVNHKNTFTIKDTAVGTGVATAPVSGADVNGAYLIHKLDAAGSSYYTTVNLKPKHYAFGANIDFFMNLDNLVEGLYFDVNTAIAKAYNKVGLILSSTQNVATYPTWETYFTGAAGTVANNEQNALAKAKLNYDSYVDKGGVEDPELLIGYNFVDNDSGKVSVNVGASIPTGTDPTREYTFEPLVGSRHFKLGLGLKACANLWESEKEGGTKQELKAVFDLNYRYAFKRDMLLTPRLKVNGTATQWGHYYLIGEITAASTTAFDPAANIITLTYEVKPGNMFDGNALLSYSHGCFVGDLGVAVEFKESHTPTLKSSWDDTKYGVAYDDSSLASDAFTTSESVALLKAHFDPKIESMCLFKVFAAAGAVMTDWDYPVTFGVGADVDIASKQQITPENWKVFGKVGITF